MGTDSENTLLKGINSGSSDAFSEIYDLYYSELYQFASKLFVDNAIDPKDVVHDVFINIWKLKKNDFVDLFHVKGYLYLSIRNKLKSYIGHKHYVNEYAKEVANNDDLFSVVIIESEVYSTVGQAIDLLPKECAEVFQLHIDGWSVKEIAEKLNKSERTIYNRKYEAIDILKRKMTDSNFTIILNLLLH